MSQIMLSHAGRTDVGIVRSHNEDAFLIDEQTRLYVVCDGVGGRQGGEVASRTAAEYIAARIRDHQAELQAVHAGEARLNKRMVANMLETAISDASGAVRERAAERPELAGMATTVVAALVVGSQAFVAHVGDSRVYLVRHKTLHQLTEDHSVMNDLRRRGAQPDRSHLGAAFQRALTRALGVLNTARVDMLDFELLPGDRLVLCSDGVCGVVGETTMQAIAPHGDANAATHMFIDTTLQNGAPDNATIIVVDVSQEAAEDRVSRVRRRLEALQAISMFRYLPYPDLMRVASVAKEVPFTAGTTIFDEGAPGDSLFVILEGRVGVIKSDVEITDLGEGAHFGEMSLIERVPRSAGIVARSNVSALVIEREGFFSLLRDEVTAVKLVWGMVRMLNQRLRTTSDELTAIKTKFGIES
jgi:serine/threonine protein phosphatase PrpC